MTHPPLSDFGHGKMKSRSGILGRTKVTRSVPTRGMPGVDV